MGPLALASRSEIRSHDRSLAEQNTAAARNYAEAPPGSTTARRFCHESQVVSAPIARIRKPFSGLPMPPWLSTRELSSNPRLGGKSLGLRCVAADGS